MFSHLAGLPVALLLLFRRARNRILMLRFYFFRLTSPAPLVIARLLRGSEQFTNTLKRQNPHGFPSVQILDR